MSTRPHLHASTRQRVVALLAATATAAAVTAAMLSSASAQAPGTRTLSLRELDKGATFVHVRNTRNASPRSNLQGDLIAFANPITDAAGARIGRLHVDCVTTLGARNFVRSLLVCTGVLRLRDGDITLQLLLSPDDRKPATGSVTGGTGAYANARGTFVSQPTRTGADTTLTLTP